VKDAMFDVTRWWYKRGVDGFRLDAVGTLFEDPQLKDNPTLPGTNEFGDPSMQAVYNIKFPEVHAVPRDLRKVADEHNTVLIGETDTNDISELKQYYGEHNNELQMPMDFMFALVDKLSPPEFRRQIATVDSAGGWPVFFISNHDIVRSYVRYGDGQHNDAIAKVMAALYLMLRGTRIMYYGEEIGMTNNDPTRKEEVKDPIGRQVGRKKRAETGSGRPCNGTERSVASELKDSSSILQTYRQLLALRHKNTALLDGEYIPLNETDTNVLSYLRRYKDQAVLVVLNMSGQKQDVSFDLTPLGFTLKSAHTLLTTSGKDSGEGSLSHKSLEPFFPVHRIGFKIDVALGK
jgi:alpha-glucosidase